LDVKMINMRYLLVFCAILMVQMAYAIIEIHVYVDENIDYILPFFNYSRVIENAPQRLRIVVENIGSVSCNLRMRSDIYRDETLEYVAWSKGILIEPGDTREINTYFYPTKSGNYTARNFIYYCNRIFEGPVVNFTAIMRNKTLNITENETERSLEIDYETTERYVDIKIKPNRDIENLVIIPRRYPLGWIFESLSVDSLGKNEEKTIRVAYIPTVWKESKIEFEFVTMDGEIYHSEEIKLEKKSILPIKDIIIVILVIINVILLMSIIYLKRLRRVEESGRREKRGGKGKRR